MSIEYLRKRFEERIWESPLAAHLDGDTDTTVAALVEGLLIEAEELDLRQPARSLNGHARRIEEAVKAAAADGFELDNGHGVALYRVDLNDRRGSAGYEELDLPLYSE
ncbi:hypothetical protein [Streptomyces sp. R44]|uniref:Uncharacterized protein n=1 Tax=Streptomyces sp. R44 TaxID=3238633 RepID=A0AB39T8J6_9ACTN